MMFLDYFEVFVWISRKMDEISKSGQFRGSMSRRRDPTQRRCREGGLERPLVRRGIEKLCRGKGLRSCVAVLRRGVATVHSMENF